MATNTNAFTDNVNELLSLAEAARILPGKPDPSTLWRWHRRGVFGVRLKTVCIGARRYISRTALQEFVDAVTKAREPSAVADQPIERSTGTLAKLGAAGLIEQPQRGRGRQQSAACDPEAVSGAVERRQHQ